MNIYKEVVIKNSVENICWGKGSTQFAIVTSIPISGELFGMTNMASVSMVDVLTMTEKPINLPYLERPKFDVTLSESPFSLYSIDGNNIMRTSIDSDSAALFYSSTDSLYNLDLSPDGQKLIIGRFDRNIGAVIDLFDIDESKVILTINASKVKNAGISQLAFSPDGTQFAAIILEASDNYLYNRKLSIWNTEQGSMHIECNLPTGDYNVSKLKDAWSSNGQYIAIATGIAQDMMTGKSAGNHRISVIDSRNCNLAKTIFSEQFVTGPIWSPNGLFIACHDNENILIFDFVSTELICRESSAFPTEQSDSKPRIQIKGLINTISWSPNGRYIVSGNHMGIRVWEINMD